MASSIRVMASALLLASRATVADRAARSCDRRCLEGFVDRYLDALVRHDPRRRAARCGCALHGERPAARRRRRPVAQRQGQGQVSAHRRRPGGAAGRLHRHARGAQCRPAARHAGVDRAAAQDRRRRDHGDRAVHHAQCRRGETRRGARPAESVVRGGRARLPSACRVPISSRPRTSISPACSRTTARATIRSPPTATASRTACRRRIGRRRPARRAQIPQTARELLGAMELPRAVRVRACCTS